ncbi:MAG TPA: hypothetical protein VNU97_14770 [Rhizomicrobium sp.]|jgi:hypothetical protein|nr:hypothetical protein [Rhizomicrobium sp.]
MTVAVLALWHDYFITVAQVSATLAGLLFVGLTISLSHVLAGNGYMSRAFVALFLQFEMLLIGIFGVVPGQPVWAVGAEFIVTGLAILAGTSIFVANFPEDPNSVLGSRGPHLVRTILAWMATVFPALAGGGIIAGWPPALYFLVPAQIACLYLSIGNAWVFAVEIPRRMQQGPK